MGGIRFECIQRARKIFPEAPKKDLEGLADHFSEGQSSAVVAKAVGVSDFDVRSYRKRWAPSKRRLSEAIFVYLGIKAVPNQCIESVFSQISKCDV